MNIGKSGCVGALGLTIFGASVLSAQSAGKSVNPETITCED